jgi:hypothetical protein
MFGGADSRAAALVPTSIEIRDNHFFKPLSLIPTKYSMKNLLEFKAGRRVLVAGNIFENNPLKKKTSAAFPANFAKWTFSRNVIVDAPAGSYPAGNFFPSTVAADRFANYAGGNYALAADGPYKNAGTDRTDIGANDPP